MGRAAEEFEREARAGLDEAFNSLIRLIATELPEVSPVYTGFFASSWQVSLSGPPAPRDEIKNFEPWAQIKREKRSRFPSFPPVIDPRFDIPRVTRGVSSEDVIGAIREIMHITDQCTKTGGEGTQGDMHIR